MTISNARAERGMCEKKAPINLRTANRCHLADTIVVIVGHKHIAARINGHAPRIIEAGV